MGLRAAEFFAGIGLVRLALEEAGIDVVFANDIEPAKFALYAANFGPSDLVLGDVRSLHGSDIPDVDLATASFPCTDLSLAGNRGGIRSGESSMFWEFARVLQEMGSRRPGAVLLENVLGFASSHGGRDLRSAIARLNGLGYICDVFALDAKYFVPQSRPRMFIVGTLGRLSAMYPLEEGPLRPKQLVDAVRATSRLRTQAFPLHLPPVAVKTLTDVVERLPPAHQRWWNEDRVAAFAGSLSPIQRRRLDFMISRRRVSWATAYRRTRYGRATWEIRADEIAGCLRTARGGSSKQALVKAGRGRLQIRWMTAREYARLQGAPDTYGIEGVSENQALFGFGDAVCVPVVSWIAREYLRPILAPSKKSRVSHG